MSQTILARKAANSSIMDYCGRTAPGFSKMDGSKLLKLRWTQFQGHSYEAVESIIA